MAVPASGELSLWKIMNEVDDDDYNAGGQYSNISLSGLSTGTVDIINTAHGLGSNRPDGSVPYGMSEFYSYNHDEPYYFTFSNFTKRNGSRRTNYSAWDTGEYILHLKPNGANVGDPSIDKRCTTTYRVVTSGSDFVRAQCLVDIRAAGHPSSFINGAASSASKYTFSNQEDTGGSGDSAGPRRTKQFFVNKITDYVLSMSNAQGS
jgi:hypothetical protein